MLGRGVFDLLNNLHVRQMTDMEDCDHSDRQHAKQPEVGCHLEQNKVLDALLHVGIERQWQGFVNAPVQP